MNIGFVGCVVVVIGICLTVIKSPRRPRKIVGMSFELVGFLLLIIYGFERLKLLGQ